VNSVKLVKKEEKRHLWKMKSQGRGMTGYQKWKWWRFLI